MRKSSLPLHFQGLNENTSTVPRVSTSLRARKGFVLGHSSPLHHRQPLMEKFIQASADHF